MSAPVPTKSIDQKYRVLKALGAGGFGVVYLAEDAQMAREVAVKVLETWATPDAVRFDREAKALSRLRHEHIVEIFAYGREQSGKPYIVMQVLDGQTLGRVLASETRIAWERAARIGMQVAEALQYAHSQGIVHRDLKPDNVMLLDQPEPDWVKVLDFGLAADVFASQEAIQKLTQTGSVVGTAQYLSPEASIGQKADARSDVYSLGCVLYQAITGRMPVEAADVLNVLYEHVHQLPPRFDKSLGVPENVELAVFKAIQKKPEDRYQSMDQFGEALNAVLKDPQNATANFSSVKLPDKPKGRPLSRNGIAIGLAALACATIAFMVPHMVPSKKGNLEKTDAWQQEQELGRLDRERIHDESAFDHYKIALSKATNRHQKFLSELALGEFALSDLLGDRQSQVPGFIDQAYRDASNDVELQQAQTFLGCSLFQRGEYQLAIQMLKSEPWRSYKSAGPGFWHEHYSMLAETGELELGLAYARRAKPDTEKAIKWLTSYLEGVRTAEGRRAVPEHQVELARLMLESGKPERKQQAIKLLQDALPFTAAASAERKYAEEHGGVAVAPKHTEAELMAGAPVIGVGHEAFMDPGATLDSVYLSNQHWSSPELNEALTARYYLGSATNEAELRKRIAECDSLLKRVKPDSEAASVLRTAEGVALVDLREYDQARAFLTGEPWKTVERRVLDHAAREAAADSLAEIYLRGKIAQPQEALKLLAPELVMPEHTGRTTMLYGCAMLMDTNKKESREFLKYIMPTQASELSRDDLTFFKDILNRYNMLDLWKP